MINITEPFLPPQKKFEAYLSQIWSSRHLTNHGPHLRQFERKMKDYFELENFSFLANGTMALQVALSLLDLKGEIITSPFSFVATTNAILWKNCTPIFADIDPYTFNVSPDNIEALITEQTSALLLPHVFGNTCEIDKMQSIATKHNLKIIYDAAHCFGTKYKGNTVFSYGDLSIVSFHATKLFHTVEGGGIFCGDDIHHLVHKFANFGYNGTPDDFICSGVNAKNSEMHAAMGLCNFEYIKEILSAREEQWNFYCQHLKGHFQLIKITNECNFNYSYFPIVFSTEAELNKKLELLKKSNISPRRYFYPSLNCLPYLDYTSMPIAEDISKKILCLPLFHRLTTSQQELIIDILLK